MKITPCTEQNSKAAKIHSFNNASRCGAKTRRGTRCMAPAIRNKQRCRMHGGNGSGAPKDSKNAFKHGYYTVEAKTERKTTQQLLKTCKRALAELGREIN